MSGCLQDVRILIFWESNSLQKVVTWGRAEVCKDIPGVHESSLLLVHVIWQSIHTQIMTGCLTQIQFAGKENRSPSMAFFVEDTLSSTSFQGQMTQIHVHKFTL